MKKALKLALEENQIQVKEAIDNIDGYEIHLYGDFRDNFVLASTLKKPIFTVHYPLKRCDCLEIAHEYETSYAKKVFEFCKRYNAGLVIHTESGFNDIQYDPKFLEFINYIAKEKITLHIENCYKRVNAIDTIRTVNFAKEKTGYQEIYPLLDTCHLSMSEMSFTHDEYSFSRAIENFKSKNFKLHLNDCIGSGEKETGGIHGTNFSMNLYLLRNIIWKLKTIEEEDGYEAVCILEVDEANYVESPQARDLAFNIDKIMADFNKIY